MWLCGKMVIETVCGIRFFVWKSGGRLPPLQGMTQDDRGDCVGKLREIAAPVCVQARDDTVTTGVYEKGRCAGHRPLGLLYMGMVVDMILAVAEVAVTAGAVPEFQLRVGHIRSAADGTLVGVGGFGSGGGGLVGAGAGEGDGAGLGVLFCFFLNSRRALARQEMGKTLATSLPKKRK